MHPMIATVERIREEASHLPYDDREALVRVLELDLATATSTQEDPGEIEAGWNEEIVSRMRDLEEGRVEPLSSDESNQRLDALFAKHGQSRAVSS